ncbi:hypothetical protein COY27_01215 [Candidatus Woesearchaeota archaeon CG_4_10_14_0_2_um_filter_33_13]|nr:MAG: hypothetical protein COY27_01215 [Candidatus Woesearchaeota archaeon CG_4_10_14_0_2_um_filter_33_13]
MKSKIGLEIELELMNSDGKVENVATNVLTDPRNDGSWVAETRFCQVEVNSRASSSIRDLEAEVIRQLLILEEVCADHGVVPIAASEFGAGQGRSNVVKPREVIYQRVLGSTLAEALNSISGVHAHIDQMEVNKTGQYNLLLALDPLSYATTSTSPILFDGTNGLNCHRVNLVRNVVYRNFPSHGELPEYLTDDAQEIIRQRKRFDDWLKVSGLSEEEFAKLFTLDNTGYSPIRRRDGIGKNGTWEVRTFDSAPLDIILGIVALYKGIYDHAAETGFNVEISNRPGEYRFEEGRIILPHFSTLKDMERKAIRFGMKDQQVVDYLRAILPFAETGLEEGDRKYLDPVKESLVTTDNPADRVMQYLRSLGLEGEKFTPEQTALANLFLRKEYLSAIRKSSENGTTQRLVA